MTIYAWPSSPFLVPTEWRHRLVENEASTVAQSGHTQTEYHQGAQWFGSLYFEDISDYDARIDFAGFLRALRGRGNRFRMQVWDYFRRRGTQSAALTISGTGQLGNTVSVSGGNGTLLRGSLLVLPGSAGAMRFLHSVAADWPGSGPISIEPQLYDSPLAAAAVWYHGRDSGTPVVEPIWRLVDPNQAEAVIKAPDIASFRLDIVNAVSGS